MIAKHLCASDAVDLLVAADVDGDLAKRVASQTRSPKARGMPLDAGNEAELRSAMKGCDLVINAALPRFNDAVMKAALESGLDYIDLAADVADVFAQSDEWKSAGLTAIQGMGEDPGMGNVFARYAADGMDRVDSIRVRDGDTASSPDYPFIALFSPETFVEETLSTSKIWRDGKYTDVPPFGEAETYEFPSPLGPLTVYSVDHEEVYTLPRFIGKGVRYVDFKLALDSNTVQTLKLFRDLRLLERSSPDGTSRRRALFSAIPKPADLVDRVDGHAALVVEVAGSKDGVRKVHTLYTVMNHREASKKYGATGTAYLTGTPAAIAAILLARGQIKANGVFAPESLDPKPFFPMLKERGIEVHERVTLERPIE